MVCNSIVFLICRPLQLSLREVVKKALEKKLLVISAGSDVLRIVPPLVITKADIDEMAEILDECLA